MKQTLKLLITCLIIIVWGFGIHGTVQAHINHSIPTAEHYSAEEIVELKTPTYTVPELPEVRLATWTDPFAVKPLIRNLTEEDWRLLEAISLAEAGNQDTEGVALVMLTVLNRCERSGQSVRQVIYAPNQFYTQGMSGTNALSNEARELIASGWDESEGCLYFCSTGWNQYGDEHLFRHQDHWFSK